MIARFRRITRKAAVLTMLVCLVGVTIGLAASGDLDSTFSGDGRVFHAFGAPILGYITDVALQPDGKIVALGFQWNDVTGSGYDLFVVRYETDGDPDLTFGSGGGLTTLNAGGYESSGSVLVDASGMIVVTARTCGTDWLDCDVIVWRLDSNGDDDPAFNGGNALIIDYDGGDNGTFGGVALDPDGKIVVAGYKTGGTYEFAAYRINTDGTLDNTFSNDGKQRFGFGSGRDDYATAIAAYGTRIVLAGYTCDADDCDFAVARMRKPGGLDPTFSSDGLQTADFGADDLAYGMARASLARMVVVGTRRTDWDRAKIAVARFDRDGNLDTTFSSDGKNTYGVGTEALARDVVIGSANSAIVAGAGRGATGQDLLVMRIRQGGGLDTSFSTDGKAFADFDGWEDGYGLVEDASGNYVVGGGWWPQAAYILARFLP